MGKCGRVSFGGGSGLFETAGQITNPARLSGGIRSSQKGRSLGPPIATPVEVKRAKFRARMRAHSIWFCFGEEVAVPQGHTAHGSSFAGLMVLRRVCRVGFSGFSRNSGEKGIKGGRVTRSLGEWREPGARTATAACGLENCRSVETIRKTKGSLQ